MYVHTKNTYINHLVLIRSYIHGVLACIKGRFLIWLTMPFSGIKHVFVKKDGYNCHGFCIGLKTKCFFIEFKIIYMKRIF